MTQKQDLVEEIIVLKQQLEASKLAIKVLTATEQPFKDEINKIELQIRPIRQRNNDLTHKIQELKNQIVRGDYGGKRIY